MRKYNFDKQHARGKMHAIERILYLLDTELALILRKDYGAHILPCIANI